MKYEIHPHANLFPMLSEKEREALKEDIQKNGQQVPIVLKQGKVLDGRNRLMACEQLGIEPVVVEYEGNDPLGFIIRVTRQR